MKIIDYINTDMIETLFESSIGIGCESYVHYCIGLMSNIIDYVFDDDRCNEYSFKQSLIKNIYNYTIKELKEIRAIKNYGSSISKVKLEVFLDEKYKSVKIISLGSYIRKYGQTPLVFKDQIKESKDIFNTLYIVYDEDNESTESSVILFGAVDKKRDEIFFIADTMNNNYDNQFNLIFVQLEFAYRGMRAKSIFNKKEIAIENFCTSLHTKILMKYINTDYIINLSRFIITINRDEILSLGSKLIIDCFNSSSIDQIEKENLINNDIDNCISDLYDGIYSKYDNLGISLDDITHATDLAIKAAYESIVNTLAFKYKLEDTSVLLTPKIEKIIHE